MADWSKPTLTSTYSNYLSETTARDVDCAVQFSTGTPTNVPTSAIKWNSSLGRWQQYSGTAWGELAATYNLTGLTCTSFSNTGNTTLGDSSADQVTVNAATWTFANATTISGSIIFSGICNFTGGLQSGGVAVLTAGSTATLTNKTFDATGTGNTFSVNGNTLTASAGTATITLPNATTTLVGRNTTDTLTNKTLSAPTLTGTVSGSGATISGAVLAAAASSTSGAGLNIAPGTAPTAPANGDIWATASGLFFQIAGATKQVPTISVTSNSNGICIAISGGGTTIYVQGGSKTVSPNTQSSYSFPVTFPTSCIGFAASSVWGAAGSGGYASTGGGPTSASAFSLFNVEDSLSRTVYWIAIGT